MGSNVVYYTVSNNTSYVGGYESEWLEGVTNMLLLSSLHQNFNLYHDQSALAIL